MSPIPGTTVYLRLPAILKDRIAEEARACGLSVNSWCMRAFEHCLYRGLELPKHKQDAGQ
jgi:predicted HicB family RNase H-like nuclease